MSDNKINITQVVTYLSHSFAKATQHYGSKNHKGTKLYSYQVEFCYLVDEIKRGPRYIVPKLISQANELIEQAQNDTVEERVAETQ